jgi:deoxyribodipyrimidine photolyase-related protein
VLSPYLNAGLLTAEEVCHAAERAYREGIAPINAVEGFIRQLIGWREYIRGVYWLRMPDYAATNALGAARPLPWFYWSGETRMRCMAECIRGTAEHAWAHHIQRLMVTGNFALIAGLAPAEVEEWYLVVYADAYEWVELPNVHGMILWADGGVIGSKPYAASGAYINRMSDYCQGCHYDVRKRSGPKACPFNYLYWDFMIRNEDRLGGNPRMKMPYDTLRRMGAGRRAEIAADAERFFLSTRCRRCRRRARRLRPLTTKAGRKSLFSPPPAPSLRPSHRNGLAPRNGAGGTPWVAQVFGTGSSSAES